MPAISAVNVCRCWSNNLANRQTFGVESATLVLVDKELPVVRSDWFALIVEALLDTILAEDLSDVHICLTVVQVAPPPDPCSATS
jgi:hypothetical protein